MSTAPPIESRGPTSEEFTSIDVVRAAEIDARHERVTAFLAEHEVDALLLQRPENVAWFTAGADLTRFGAGGDGTTALLVTADARLVATNDVDSPRIFEHELAGMGFQLKERPWHEDPGVLVRDLTRGRSVASDLRNRRAVAMADDVASLRLPLSAFDVQRMRTLGRIAAHAVEATCRHLERGRTELELAGELAHRLVKNGAYPARLTVQGDDRGERYRHWTPQHFPVESHAHVGVVARRWGLHVAATRTVCLERPSDDFVRAHHVGMLAQATALHFARNGQLAADVWAKIERIYDKFGEPDAWRSATQGELVGYDPHERTFLPDGDHALRTGDAIHWHPSVGAATSGDTMIVLEDGNELLTPMEEWPRLTIEVKGHTTQRPAILRRDRDEPTE